MRGWTFREGNGPRGPEPLLTYDLAFAIWAEASFTQQFGTNKNPRARLQFVIMILPWQDIAANWGKIGRGLEFSFAETE